MKLAGSYVYTSYPRESGPLTRLSSNPLFCPLLAFLTNCRNTQTIMRCGRMS